ncbi:hypothetical protein JQ633_02635 [Bradyrhizobium tropiciagri]|uniref:hypothetical protein n=1 Tax=Bradyrhizobium tropiciagri TaxID=312253 RepID=UPI001BABC8C8|nr:hypothetical protein [Bradyrhizobium tropiciagri]MBR0869240.1 hypothetical protein [Bradyrhizobium tropiciagri]
MDDDVTKRETVLIPGELRLSNPMPPPITVPLPIVALPDRGKNVLLGLPALALGLLCLLPMGAFLSLVVVLGAPVASFINPSQWPSSILAFASLIFLMVAMLFYGVIFTGTACTCLWDAMRGDAVLEIATDGLRDRRSGLSIPWSSVRSARLLGSLGVDLELRDAAANWQNPFRVGVVFQRYRPVPNHAIVSVAFLDVSAHVVAYTILTLVQSNDGEVITKMPGGPEMYPRLIALRVAR